jgi:3-oxoacyl-[acyl-carrier protein] reductase
MSDRYQNFINSKFGKKVAKIAGLPTPVFLERFDSGQSCLINTPILAGAAAGATLLPQALKTLQAAGVAVVSTDTTTEALTQEAGLKLKSPVSANATNYKAVLFDASGIKSSNDLIALHSFFSPIARSIAASGKILITGITPESISDPKYATAQRALEGFVRAIAKEFKKGISAQLIYAPLNQDVDLTSSLYFFLSPKSAYVSAQVVRLNAAPVQTVSDWRLPLSGKVALVTGASRGIGEAIAHTLARDGAKVICLDVPSQASDLEKVANRIHGTSLPLDVTAADAAEQIMTHTKALGGLDIIVHNAGITRDKMLANMPASTWSLVNSINLACQEQINDTLLANNAINPNGRVICVSSISGIAGNLGQTNYATSKAGVIGMVQAVAKTLNNGITINAVAPGFIETQMTAAIPLSIREAGRRMNSMSQGGQPVDVAEAISWFANPSSGGINGQIVRVCGQSLLGA